MLEFTDEAQSFSFLPFSFALAMKRIPSEEFKRTAEEPLCPDLLGQCGVPTSDEA